MKRFCHSGQWLSIATIAYSCSTPATERRKSTPTIWASKRLKRLKYVAMWHSSVQITNLMANIFLSRALAAYTSYMSVETVEKFLDDCPNISDSLENVKGLDSSVILVLLTSQFFRSLKDFITQSLRSMRAAVREANLDGEEFLAVLLLTFWFPGTLQN